MAFDSNVFWHFCWAALWIECLERSVGSFRPAMSVMTRRWSANHHYYCVSLPLISASLVSPSSINTPAFAVRNL